MNTPTENDPEVREIVRRASDRHAYRNTSLTSSDQQSKDEALLARLDRLRNGREETNDWWTLTAARDALTRRMIDRSVRMRYEARKENR